MSSSTEPKPPMNEEDGTEKAYNVEEDDVSETDHFSRVKPHLLKTPSILNAIVDQIHPDIIAKSHQSNFVLFPPKLEGCTVVDLGCGVGRDVFILSKLVGEHGRVIGIDSDKDQLEFARQHTDYHIKKFGLTKVNVEFIEGNIDQINKTNLQENSIDVIVSNSVVNYRRDKKAIIEGVCKILKPGGEFYFSDVYVNRPIPAEYQDLLAGEYIGGALRWEDLILYATEAGFTQPRLVTAKPYVITNEDIQKAIGTTKFVSAIFRCFKLPSNDNDSTPFNIPYQLTYETPLTSAEEEFFFDHSLQFKLGELLVVDDPSIALALSLSRYKDNFTFDPIAATDAETVTIIETIEELPSVSDNNTGEAYKKTTTIITTTTPNQ
ncbi:unnamed protein product [Adineta steineri]|uniref:Arsenite methyltransferase n=1 Tax=Adineta steineri TaxID=433720 RepID=A0A813XZF9_9BILA|nr:unnamed protein product [Adineta steineri]CAF0874340.1 unnamed protein product [Adineta steineri]CAF3492263.1 unnamed protein product [Adineta steineri]CAF3528738.1 unnamed protein product [Adineta steineri]CAF3750762.1 unnamed protein product [Adineta steineri]